ncbi:MAG TPA: BadF/BadG/BcrA/BcrD ATPase family protein [Bryobacteraceae bacterium]|nr:BadF/BadG/BcrA/BcrD ATPase family protein [Bryobacteraceae bacterium]
MPRLFLGVDGGQSSTTALIADETGRVLGTGRGGPCNHLGAEGGREKFTLAIQNSVTQACRDAGCDCAGTSFEAACLGFSGGPADKEALVKELIRAQRLIVTTDAFIALSGATGGEAGIVVIAGTGSIALGRNAAGKTARAGGWGYVFGDEGAAFDLVRQALRAALRFEEGWGPPTCLHALLLDETGARSAAELLHRFYTADYPRDRVAALAPLVDRAAQDNDAVACALLDKAGQDLATLAFAVRRQIFGQGETALVAYLGGAFRSDRLRERFRMLVELEEGNRVVAPRFGPAAGALIEAWRAAGLRPTFSGLPASEK